MLDSIGDTLTLTAGKYPNKIAVVEHGGSKLAYREFNERVNRLANALIALGIKKGDKIAYLFFNCSQFAETHYAVAKAGAVGVPLNFRLVGRELSYQINNSDAVCLIYGPEFVQTVESIRQEIPGVKHFICAGNGSGDVLKYEELIKDNSPAEPGVEVGLYDENLILYTAGTTGAPKGSVLTHKNHLFNGMTMIMDYGMRPDDVMQIIPPLYHSASLNGFMIPGVLLGATLVLHKEMDPQQMLQAIQEYKITITWGAGHYVGDGNQLSRY